METLKEAKDWLRSQVDDGARCPCCNQFAKVYRRKVTSTAVRALVLLYNGRGKEDGWVHVPTTAHLSRAGGDIAKMAYWGLVEESTSVRSDGGRAGWWKITPTGISWLLGHSTIPKYARVYNGRCLNLLGPGVTVVECLGENFDLQELMAG